MNIEEGEPIDIASRGRIDAPCLLHPPPPYRRRRQEAPTSVPPHIRPCAMAGPGCRDVRTVLPRRRLLLLLAVAVFPVLDRNHRPPHGPPGRQDPRGPTDGGRLPPPRRPATAVVTRTDDDEGIKTEKDRQGDSELVGLASVRILSIFIKVRPWREF
jgi:hypothetical protein